jgi:hypothetical protein
LRKVLDDFVQESHDELFLTKEECLAWAHREYASVVDGSRGGNLLSKYSMIGRFYVLTEGLDFLETAVRHALGKSLTDERSQMLRTVIDYLKAILLHVPFRDTLSRMPEWETAYDVEAWRSDHYRQPLEQYRVVGRRRYSTRVSPDTQAKIMTRIETFGEHPSGLGKFTRTMFARDLRRSLEAQPPPDSVGMSLGMVPGLLAFLTESGPVLSSLGVFAQS